MFVNWMEMAQQSVVVRETKGRIIDENYRILEGGNELTLEINVEYILLGLETLTFKCQRTICWWG